MTLPAVQQPISAARSGRSAANPLHAAVDRWDRQTDRRTDNRLLHRPCAACCTGRVSNPNQGGRCPWGEGQLPVTRFLMPLSAQYLCRSLSVSSPSLSAAQRRVRIGTLSLLCRRASDDHACIVSVHNARTHTLALKDGHCAAN